MEKYIQCPFFNSGFLIVVALNIIIILEIMTKNGHFQVDFINLHT